MIRVSIIKLNIGGEYRMISVSQKLAQDIYSAMFVFSVHSVDDEFESLNNEINAIAEKNKGYLGKEYWQNSNNQQEAVIYYWKSLEGLNKFAFNSTHLKAKKSYKRWYVGYRIIISKIVKIYGDGSIPKPEFLKGVRDKV